LACLAASSRSTAAQIDFGELLEQAAAGRQPDSAHHIVRALRMGLAKA